MASYRLVFYFVSSRRKVIRSFLSFAFFRPPKAIFVPGMYFLGFSRYSNCLLLSALRQFLFCVLSTYQSVLVPLDALLLVRVGVREALDLASVAAEEAVEVGSDLVALALLQVMALRASCLEKVCALLLVTCGVVLALRVTGGMPAHRAEKRLAASPGRQAGGEGYASVWRCCVVDWSNTAIAMTSPPPPPCSLMHAWEKQTHPRRSCPCPLCRLVWMYEESVDSRRRLLCGEDWKRLSVAVVVCWW